MYVSENLHTAIGRNLAAGGRLMPARATSHGRLSLARRQEAAVRAASGVGRTTSSAVVDAPSRLWDAWLVAIPWTSSRRRCIWLSSLQPPGRHPGDGRSAASAKTFVVAETAALSTSAGCPRFQVGN